MVLNRTPWTDDTRIMWGEHRGKLMRDIPASYLVWLLDQRWIGDWPGLHRYLKLREKDLRDKVIVAPTEHAIPDSFNSFQDYLNDRRGF